MKSSERKDKMRAIRRSYRVRDAQYNAPVFNDERDAEVERTERLHVSAPARFNSLDDMLDSLGVLS